MKTGAQAGQGTAIVTGAGSRRGIGREIAHQLARAGHSIAVLDLDDEAATGVALEIEAEFDVPTMGRRIDVSDMTSVDEAILAIEHSEMAPVSVLVNNAGINLSTPIEDIGLDEWNRVFAINVTGTFLVTQRVLPGLRSRHYGRIINMSSLSAVRGGGFFFGATHYSASKGAILSFTRALAREVGGDGITVNVIAPGFIETDMTGAKTEGERLTHLLSVTPVGRLGRPQDVAALVAFLASSSSGYITGATIDVNGGSHIY